jgi:hypothetical protein
LICDEPITAAIVSSAAILDSPMYNDKMARTLRLGKVRADLLGAFMHMSALVQERVSNFPALLNVKHIKAKGSYLDSSITDPLMDTGWVT